MDKLAHEGFVRVEQEREGHRPPRRVYHVTEAGEAHFYRLLRDNLADYSRTYFPTDVGIAFMDQLPPDEVASYLYEKRARIQAELQALQGATGHGGTLAHVLERNRRLLQTGLEWLDDLLERLTGS